jgi:PelA/Pel-15E family pectate lyase
MVPSASLSFVLLALVPSSQGAAPAAPPSWGPVLLRQKAEWYATPQARAIADSVLQYQSSHGAWPKNTDLTKTPVTAEIRRVIETSGSANTIDNGATTTPMRFLALVGEATGEVKYRDAFERGVDYLLASQYQNGGWPQFFPLREGYYSHVTFNDDAMVNVLTLVRDVAAGKVPYAFVSPARKARAADAFARGIDVILRTQLKQDGKLTAWCAQYDEKTLEPAWARKYEPPSLSGNESVGLTRLLMDIEQPKPEVVAAVEASVAWLRTAAIPGLRLEEFTGADGKKDRRVVADPAAPLIWARFYELGTHRPIFLGRDSKVHYAVSEIEHERRNGYAYYGAWPASLVSKDYPRWRARLGLKPTP